jgi:hypothetical protein
VPVSQPPVRRRVRVTESVAAAAASESESDSWRPGQACQWRAAGRGRRTHEMIGPRERRGDRDSESGNRASHWAPVRMALTQRY